MQSPNEARGTRAFVYRHDPQTDSYVPLSVNVTNNGLDVNIQDQHTEVIDAYMMRPTGSFSLVQNYNINSYDLIISGAAAPTTGDLLFLKENVASYQGEILSFSVTGSNWLVTLDTPLDYPYTTGGMIHTGPSNMNVSGSQGTPIEFIVSPSGLASGLCWDITNIEFELLDQTAMDDKTFGGIASLTNGLVLRSENGTTKNIFNVKNNGDFALRNNSEVVYSPKAPAGFFGFNTSRRFGGQGNNGVTIRLCADTNDTLKLIIRDDLTDIDEFYCVVQGHVVE
jgi:hypothetical protein